MRDDGSLRQSSSQTTFSRFYDDGVGREAPLDPAPSERSDDDRASGPDRALAASATIPIPHPAILTAIDAAALRYAGHPGLRRAGLTTTAWRLLLRANIEIESRYDPEARSPMGAIGLGQLMPGTAEDLGVDPTDWRENLDGSARYLARLLDEFGDARLALAAYNAGPSAVIQHGGIPPYPETRNHVRRVLTSFDRLVGELS